MKPQRELTLSTVNLNGTRTRLFYKKGSDPTKPLVVYSPGIFGDIGIADNGKDFLQKSIPRTALNSGCSLLALNTIDQDPDGVYPPRDIDFGKCMDMIQRAFETSDTSNGVIPVLNSWGTTPITASLDKMRHITVKAVLGIGATMNAHKSLQEGIKVYHQVGLISDVQLNAYENGETISDIAYPPPPHSTMKVSINKAFLKAQNNLQLSGRPIPVEGQIVFMRGCDDEHVTPEDTNALKLIYRNSVQAQEIEVDGGHWADRDAQVGATLSGMIQRIK